MDNSFSPRIPAAAGNSVKLVFWGGSTALLRKRRPLAAGAVVAGRPDLVVCRAGSFYIGQPVPAVQAAEELVPGETYFALPADRLPPRTLTVASLSALSSGPRGSAMDFGGCRPFQYVKGAGGRTLMRVSPEFITRIISEESGGGGASERRGGDGRRGELCTTEELKKHYAQLVAPRGQRWAPKLETILSERRRRFSPRRFLGFRRR